MELEFIYDYYNDVGPYNEDMRGVFRIDQIGKEDYDVTLLYINFGEARIDRGLAVRMYGKRAVLAAESYVSEQYAYERIETC